MDKLILGRMSEVVVYADSVGLTISSERPNHTTSERTNWSAAALASPRGMRAAIELSQALEMGFAEVRDGSVLFPFANFQALHEAGLSVTRFWSDWSPFSVRINRVSDIGRRDFRYVYEFLHGAVVIPVERWGYYLRRGSDPQVFHVDDQTYSLVQEMDQFNAGSKEKVEAWRSIANVQEHAREVGAQLDPHLSANVVIQPSSIGLGTQVWEDKSVSFVPAIDCEGGQGLRDAFLRNEDVLDVYSIDSGKTKTRVVLSGPQLEVLERMKEVHRAVGRQKARALENPASFFDGVLEHVEISYGERVQGIGDFQFVASPQLRNLEPVLSKADIGSVVSAQRPTEITCALLSGGTTRLTFADDSEMQVFRTIVEEALRSGLKSVSYQKNEIEINSDLASALERPPEQVGKSVKDQSGKYLLIYTNEDEIQSGDAAAARAVFDAPAQSVPYSPPEGLCGELKPHQVEGVKWLQSCHVQMPHRKGTLLADDMGLGKTLQILTYLAWCIEKRPELGLSASKGPWRPILVIVPLILLEDQTWQTEARRFFANQGDLFEPMLELYGPSLQKFRTTTTGREVEVGKPVLDVEALRNYRLVVTNYQTVVNYQHSLAQHRNGKSIWSVVIADEAQEFKTPNSKVSHAVKALQPEFFLACTGTPVENRLLDLWNIMDAVQPALLGESKEFHKRYEVPIASEDSSAAMAELKKQLLFGMPNAFVKRRNKTELTDLPPKLVKRLSCVMSSEEVSAHVDLLRALGDSGTSGHLGVLHKITQLYQHPALLVGAPEALDADELLRASGKLRAVMELLTTIQGKHEKVIIFARYIAMQQVLASVISSLFKLNVEIINGSPSASNQGGLVSKRSKGARKEILQRFGSKKGFNVLILSPFVAGIGLTITEANHVIHYGRWWNPAVEAQATDRVYRIGQTKPVFVHLPIYSDPSGRLTKTFDERLDALLVRKEKLAHDFLRPADLEDRLAKDLCEDLLEDAGKASVSRPLNMEDVDRMDPYQFEAFVACLFEAQGYKTVLTAKGNDGGADVLAVRRGELVIVQAKHCSGRQAVDEGAIGDLLAAQATYNTNLRFSLSMVAVTNSVFTEAAHRLSSDLGIQLIQRTSMAHFLHQYEMSISNVLVRETNRAKSFRDGIEAIKALLGF